MIRRTSALLLTVVLLGSTAAAQVPEFNVVPDTVDENLSAYNQHDLEFTFTNPDSRDIFNLTLENTSYLSWDTNNFRLNSSQTKTVNASFYTENVTTFNETLTSTYKYGGSDNDFDGENISIQVSTFYENTGVNVSALNKDFELEFGATDTSAFTIENTGSEDAFGVELQAEDIKFDRSDGFTVPAGEDVLVQYDVSIPKPEDNATAATNRTYEREVTVSGENFNESGFTAEVFVPFKQYDTSEAQENFADRFVEFCRDYPESNFCTGEQIVEYRNNTKVVNNTPVYEANLTEDTKEALQILAQTRSEDYQDILNRVKLQQNTFRSELEATRSNFSENLEEVQEDYSEVNQSLQNVTEMVRQTNQEELRESRSRTFWLQIGVFVLFLYVVGRGVRWTYENWEELTEDRRW
jgi:hypothetical protein